ncbi:MAG: type VI secretion system-associated protein TagO [Halomonas sp.]|uniref:type VI secretion system-associated protein TagO n=1 Tax=Halomonadaceae TaxID=28256 RepID=UPI001F46883D|nr:type VI secretion system-associated protein TagO [Halomonas profundi]
MSNWKVVGTIVAGVVVVGWLGSDKEDTRRDSRPEASSANSALSTAEAESTPANEPAVEADQQEPAAPPTPPKPRSPWQVRENVSQMDDSRNVFLSTQSNERIPGRYGRSTVRPTLTVRCVENTTALVLNMDGHHMASSPYHSWGNVEMRIDDSRAFTKSMNESTDNRALGLWNGGNSIPVIRQMFGAEQLTLRATPFSESAMTMTFNIRDLDEEIAPLREACHW